MFRCSFKLCFCLGIGPLLGALLADSIPDTFAEAIQLEINDQTIEAAIDFGGDRDFFTFTLEERMYLTATTTGSTDTLGRLYDASESLIVYNDDGGAGRNFEIERWLEPGKYFLRVEGFFTSTQGAYNLVLQWLERLPLSFTVPAQTLFTWDESSLDLPEAVDGLSIDYYFDGSPEEPTGYGTFSVQASLNDSNYEGYTIFELTLTDPFEHTEETFPYMKYVARGWFWDASWGLIEISDFPWIYNPAMGWFYSGAQEASENISVRGRVIAPVQTPGWIWLDFLDDWVFSVAENGSYLWSQSRQAWIYLFEDNEGEGWIYDFEDSAWSRLQYENPIPFGGTVGSPAPVISIPISAIDAPSDGTM